MYSHGNIQGKKYIRMNVVLREGMNNAIQQAANPWIPARGDANPSHGAMHKSSKVNSLLGVTIA